MKASGKWEHVTKMGSEWFIWMHDFLSIEISSHAFYSIKEILEKKVQDREVYTSEGDFGYYLRQVQTRDYISLSISWESFVKRSSLYK